MLREFNPKQELLRMKKKKFELLLLPYGSSRSRLLSRQESGPRILHRSEFFDEELHRRRQVASSRYAKRHRCGRHDLYDTTAETPSQGKG